METKVLPLTEATITDDGPGSFAGYASRFSILDGQGDICVPGCFSKTLPQFKQRGFISNGHDWKDPVATIREAREDSIGLWIEADFHSDPASQIVRTRTKERLERGKFTGLSIGFQTVKDDVAAKGPRKILEAELFEVAIVTVPALREAGVVGVKDGEAELKPFPGEHSCRISSPSRFDRFRRVNDDRRHNGKRIDVIYGHPRSGGGWEQQALRLPTSDWDAAAARSYCADQQGSFEAAEAAALADALVELKAGRRLSAASRTHIQGVIDALTAFLQDPEADLEDELEEALAEPAKSVLAVSSDWVQQFRTRYRLA